VEELRRHLLAVVARIIPRGDDAEEVVQEALLRLVAAHSDGREIRDEHAYATRVAVRLAVDRLRRRRGRRAKLHDVAQFRESDAPRESTPADVHRLYEAVAALPARQAAVVTLRKLMELDYSDVADILGISQENCRSHCRLALQRLREVLRDDR
jgi:RNA polymerase sigma factor (sigma-70 family)